MIDDRSPSDAFALAVGVAGPVFARVFHPDITSVVVRASAVLDLIPFAHVVPNVLGFPKVVVT